MCISYPGQSVFGCHVSILGFLRHEHTHVAGNEGLEIRFGHIGAKSAAEARSLSLLGKDYSALALVETFAYIIQRLAQT